MDDWLCVASGYDESWVADNGWIMDRWEIHSANNLKDWRKEAEVHPKVSYISGLQNCFSGDIILRDNKYVGIFLTVYKHWCNGGQFSYLALC